MTFYDNKNIGLGLSGGINSAAVLCWLVEQCVKPKVLYIYYAHFAEHSPDTFQFVADQIRYARKHFDTVVVKITSNSVLRFFEQEHLIPHPTVSPCSKRLKIEPMERWFFESGVQVDLIGYIRSEKKRINRQAKNSMPSLFSTKQYPIQSFDDEWCFQIVERHIGWYPAIYKIVDAKSKRIFKHNNCLPCKNMYVADMQHIAVFYPKYMEAAVKLSGLLKAYWGRNADAYYTEFGKEDYEATQCEVCSFD